MSTDDQILNHLIELKASNARVEATLDTTIKAYETRFAAIEKRLDDSDRWENIKVICVIPIITALHFLANKIGLRV